MKHLLENSLVVGHNLKFDLKFLKHHFNIEPIHLFDTWNAEILISGGLKARQKGAATLEAVTRQYIGLQLEKDAALRQSFRGHELTEEQIQYAAMDVAVLPPIHERQLQQLEELELMNVFETEMVCIPATVWLELSGIPVDREGLKKLALETRQKLEEAQFRVLTLLKESGYRHLDLSGLPFVNLNSFTFDDLPEPEPAKQDTTSTEGIPTRKNTIWRVNNTHNGIEISFNHKPSEEIRNRMKRAGFRWSRYQGIWYAKDTAYTRQVAQELADQGEAAGEKLSYAEQVEAERQRALARQGRLEKAIEKSEAEAESRFETAHKMDDVIPFGQPILVGHHSEKSDRSYRARIDSHHKKGVEAYQRAKDLKSRLEGSEKLQAKQENPGALARKVDKFETELRKLKLHEHWYKDRTEFERKMADLEEKVAYWKQVLADVGGLKITSKDVKPGDLVKYRGSWYKVKRVNPKSVTIEGWMGIPDWTYLADYSYISDVKRLKENPNALLY